MIKRKILDIITILFIILIIAGFFLSNYVTKNFFDSIDDEASFSGNIHDEINKLVLSWVLIFLPINLLAFIYYIFILVLAIQLYKEERLSLPNTIVIGIFFHFAIIFYLTGLRKPLKQYELETSPQF